jgi:hypothetical protein
MSPAARKLIYIVSLSHSGSTVLDMLLTTGRKAVGLGQIWTVIGESPSERRNRQCSCGKPAPECPIWGPILDRLEHLPDAAWTTERYRLVLEHVVALCGPDIAVVDSSKNPASLVEIKQALPELDVKVLHNVKDVRAFTVSTLDNAVRKGRRAGLPETIFWQWYCDNRRFYGQATQALGREPLRVLYEGLCLSTEKMAARINEDLGENYIDIAGPLDVGHTHIISGNRTRLPEAGKSKQLAYDYGWLSRTEWLRPYALLPMVRRYNEQNLRDLGKLLVRT